MANTHRTTDTVGRELNGFTSIHSISAMLKDASRITNGVGDVLSESSAIHSGNRDNSDRQRYDSFVSAIKALKGTVGGNAGQTLDKGVKSFLSEIQNAGGHKIGNAELGASLGKLNAEISAAASAIGGVKSKILSDLSKQLSSTQTLAYFRGVGALSDGTRASGRTARKLGVASGTDSTAVAMAQAVKLTAGAVGDSALKKAMRDAAADMLRLSRSAKTASEQQKALTGAQKRFAELSKRSTTSSSDRAILNALLRQNKIHIRELKKANANNFWRSVSASGKNAQENFARTIGAVARYAAPLKKAIEIGNSMFQEVNGKVNRFARLQIGVSAERGQYGRKVRGIGMNYGHMMAAIGAGRSAGMEDGQVVGRMIDLQTQLAQARWGEGGLAENVGKWGISVYNGAGDVKQSHDLMIEFSRKLRSFTTDMEKLQFLHAIHMGPEQMEYVANYERSARRMEMLKKNPHLQTVLDKADILDESGFNAKADAATRTEIRRREILNQNALEEGVLPGLIRSLHPENWFFNDWTARRKGMAVAREELSGSRATRALEAILAEMKKNGGKTGSGNLSGLTVSDIMALTGGFGGWADQDKDLKGNVSFVADLESAFERMSGFSSDTRSNVEKLGDGLLSVVKKVVDLFAGLLNIGAKVTKDHPVLGTAATLGGAGLAAWGVGKAAKGVLGWIGRGLGIGGAVNGAAAAKAASRFKGRGKLIAGISALALTALMANQAEGAEVPENFIGDGEDETKPNPNGGGPTNPPPATTKTSATARTRRRPLPRSHSPTVSDYARSLHTANYPGFWTGLLGGFAEGLSTGVMRNTNALGSAITFGLWDGPFSKELTDLGYEDWMTKTGDVASTIGAESLVLAATLGTSGALKGGVAAGRAALKAGRSTATAGQVLGKGVTAKSTGKMTAQRAKNIMKKSIADSTTWSGLSTTGKAGMVVAGAGAVGEGLLSGSSEEETTPTVQPPQGGGGTVNAPMQHGSSPVRNFVSGKGESLMNLVEPVRDMIRNGASYNQVSEMLGKYGMAVPDMSVLQSKEFLEDDQKAMETLKGLGYAKIQMRGTEKYGKPMNLRNFLRNVTDDIAVTFKNGGGVMTDEEIIQTFGRQEAGANDVSERMIDFYSKYGHEIGIGAQQKLSEHVARLTKEHGDWDQDKVLDEAKKARRAEFLQGMNRKTIEMIASRGGAVTDKDELAKNAAALFAASGIERSEIQKFDHEQAAGFAKFRTDNPDLGVAQAIARYSNRTGMSKDSLRNLLMNGQSSPDSLTEEERAEWMKGSDYKAQQAERTRAEKKKKRAERYADAALSVSAEDAEKYLGDAGDAKEFLDLRERVKAGGQLDEADKRAYDAYVVKVGRKAVRSRKHGPLTKAYVPTAAEQAAIDDADKESARLVEEKRRNAGKPELAVASDVRFMHSIRSRGGGTMYDLARGFGQDRMRQYKEALGKGELSEIDTKILDRERHTMRLQERRDATFAKEGIVQSGYPLESEASLTMAAKVGQTEQVANSMAMKGQAAETAAASAKLAAGESSAQTEKNITINMGGQTITQNIQGEYPLDTDGMKQGTQQGASEIRDKTAEAIVAITKSMGTY